MKRVQFTSPTLPYLFLLPQMAVVFVFFYWPSVQAIQSSFYLEDPFGFGATFVGLDNYAEALNAERGCEVDEVRWGTRVRGCAAMETITIDQVIEKLSAILG